MAVGGTAGAQKSFKFHGGNHIVDTVVTVFRDYRRVEDIVSSGQNDSAYLQVQQLVLLFEVNSVCLANLGTDAALFPLTQLATVLSINAVGGGNALGKILIYGRPLAQPLIVCIFNSGWTLLHAGTAASAKVLVYIACLFTNLYLECTHLAVYLFHFAVGEEIDFWMPTGIQQLRRENSDGAVVGGKGLVQLSHFAADTRELFHQMDLDSHFS